MEHPSYFDAVDHRQLLRDYPLGADFAERRARISRDELRQWQERQFLSCLERAWQIPFYRRLWSAEGIEPGDIGGLDDLPRLPCYDKGDLMRSVEEHPPFGDFHGMESFGDGPAARPPVILHTTSGTTGLPQPLLFGPKSREVQNILMARAFLLQGLRADDLVHSVFGFGTVNGGHYAREAISHFTNALVLTAGTGAETRSAQQVRLMQGYGATVLIGFADYLRKLAEVARQEGLEPGRDIRIRLICAAIGGERREALSEAWAGARVCDFYGVGDTGFIAAEGPEQDGLHIWEDAHLVEIIDPDSLAPLADGAIGNVCVTALFKDDIFPNIRFNTNDLSAVETTPSPIGWSLRRLRGFLGRSDDMVKLRGINVYPPAIGALLKADGDINGEFFCRVRRRRGRDEMTVLVESPAAAADRPALAARYGEMLRQHIGLELLVELAEPGALAPLTEIDRRQKPLRLDDGRKREG
ncbi:MAG: phenylacetate--CoA ligase family protein [Alphaproteobacteria bacterium]|nr:phenylacetate--CoA ligase family protein [Alphaproteobacteria bacterium]